MLTLSQGRGKWKSPSQQCILTGKKLNFNYTSFMIKLSLCSYWVYFCQFENATGRFEAQKPSRSWAELSRRRNHNYTVKKNFKIQKINYKKRIIKYNEKGRGREGIVTPPYFKVHVIYVHGLHNNDNDELFSPHISLILFIIYNNNADQSLTSKRM